MLGGWGIGNMYNEPEASLAFFNSAIKFPPRSRIAETCHLLLIRLQMGFECLELALHRLGLKQDKYHVGAGFRRLRDFLTTLCSQNH